jgi:hypothetical protein
MPIAMEEGAGIVVRDWLRLRSGERLTIVSDELHVAEAMAMRARGAEAGGLVVLVVVPSASPQSGELFDARCSAFLGADAIIGATHASIMTTRAIRDAVRGGARFLSVPLSTNDGASLLEGDMMTMPPEEAARLGGRLALRFARAREARARTALGTDLRFSLEGRSGSLFRGLCDAPGVSTSASFEYSCSVVEDETEGCLLLDGSMGYIGLVDERGRLVDIEANASGRRLAAYLEGFGDSRMYHAGELGIGLNTRARCAGRSYIEDESAFGTFHVGMGRNIALGGKHYANGHFDLVAREPDIEVDGVHVMRKGQMVAG